MTDRWVQDHQRDAWRRQSKAAGYRARSAYKLKQIQNRFMLMAPGDVILDVGCHPGGWAQVAVEETGETGVVIGVDLDPCKPVEGAKLLVGDITDPSCQDRVVEALDGRSLNVIISDISPDITGRWQTDQAIAMDLVAKVVDFSLPLLCAGGRFVTKVFQGHGIEELVKAMKPHFSRVRRFSPDASRNSSSEVYLVCINHKPWVAGQDGPEVVKAMEKAFDDDEDEVVEDIISTRFRVIRRSGEEE